MNTYQPYYTVKRTSGDIFYNCDASTGRGINCSCTNTNQCSKPYCCSSFIQHRCDRTSAGCGTFNPGGPMWCQLYSNYGGSCNPFKRL